MTVLTLKIATRFSTFPLAILCHVICSKNVTQNHWKPWKLGRKQIDGLVQDCSNSIANTLSHWDLTFQLLLCLLMAEVIWGEVICGCWSLVHYSDIIMSTMASQITCLTIVYSTVYSGRDEKIIKALRHWPLWGEFVDDRWIPCTKGQ